MLADVCVQEIVYVTMYMFIMNVCAYVCVCFVIMYVYVYI